jgi:histone H3/H4
MNYLVFSCDKIQHYFFLDATTDGLKSKPAKKVSTQNKISELPLSKVKSIIKLDPEVNLVNADAVFLVTKATEAFVKQLSAEAFNHAAQQKKKTITKSHVDQSLTMLWFEL